jgi:hypothetical protein
MTKEQKAFMHFYGKCMAVASDDEVKYFFANKNKAQEGTYKEQQAVRDGIVYWGHIEDAWLLWLEAVNYAKDAIKPKSFAQLEIEKPSDFRN